MENYFVELQLDEKWFKAVMDLIDVDIYEGEVCRVNRIEVMQCPYQMDIQIISAHSAMKMNQFIINI